MWRVKIWCVEGVAALAPNATVKESSRSEFASAFDMDQPAALVDELLARKIQWIPNFCHYPPHQRERS
jgi:hypothetical protein